MLSHVVTFESFVQSAGARLRGALVAAYGLDVGADAASEALAYGWEHWERVGRMENPAGYLYRVGQTAARRSARPAPLLPAPPPAELPAVEPGLPAALAALSEPQRVCVMLVHAFGWSLVDTAEVTGTSVSTVRTHLARGLAKLQDALEVSRDVG